MNRMKRNVALIAYMANQWEEHTNKEWANHGKIIKGKSVCEN